MCASWQPLLYMWGPASVAAQLWSHTGRHLTRLIATPPETYPTWPLQI